MQMQRMAEIERGSIDLETGRFPMILATEGEASDGHILSISGGVVPERMPLLISHENDPRSLAGSVIEPKRGRGQLRAYGEIDMAGDGPIADVRRDIAHMISQGHLRGVSLRWEPTKWTERSALDKGHPAYVSERESGAKRWGLYFESWRALEGSVVAIGADPAALIGRSQETAGTVSAFWRSLVEQGREQTESWIPLSIHLRTCGENTELADKCRSLEERVAALTTTPRQAPAVEGIDFGRLLEAEVAAYEDRLHERLNRWAETTLGRIIR